MSSGFTLCVMKQTAIDKYNNDLSLILLCEEIEKDNEQFLLSQMGGLDNFPLGVNMDVVEHVGNLQVDRFDNVLNFWCDTPWWWNEELAKKLQMEGNPRVDLKD